MFAWLPAVLILSVVFVMYIVNHLTSAKSKQQQVIKYLESQNATDIHIHWDETTSGNGIHHYEVSYVEPDGTPRFRTCQVDWHGSIHWT